MELLLIEPSLRAVKYFSSSSTSLRFLLEVKVLPSFAFITRNSKPDDSLSSLNSFLKKVICFLSVISSFSRLVISLINTKLY